MNKLVYNCRMKNIIEEFTQWGCRGTSFHAVQSDPEHKSTSQWCGRCLLHDLPVFHSAGKKVKISANPENFNCFKRCNCWLHQAIYLPLHMYLNARDKQMLSKDMYKNRKTSGHIAIYLHRTIVILTFIAFFMYLALSLSMSWWERMGYFSSSPTTMPGPWVHAPPANSMIRAPVFGYVHWAKKPQHIIAWCVLKQSYTWQ